MRPSRIISGAQTGADRAGLDAALELGIPIGGWVPKGRKAEDGKVPEHYFPFLREATTADYPTRTRLNVIDSTATIIFHVGPMGPGSRLTVGLCYQHGRPHLNVDMSLALATSLIRSWIDRNVGAGILNVAGGRESTSPGIYEWTKRGACRRAEGAVNPVRWLVLALLAGGLRERRAWLRVRAGEFGVARRPGRESTDDFRDRIVAAMAPVVIYQGVNGGRFVHLRGAYWLLSRGGSA